MSHNIPSLLDQLPKPQIFPEENSKFNITGCKLKNGHLLFRLITLNEKNQRRKIRSFNELKQTSPQEFGNFLEKNTIFESSDKRVELRTHFINSCPEKNKILKVFKAFNDKYLFLIQINGKERIVGEDQIKLNYNKEYIDYLSNNLVLTSGDEIN